MTTYQTTRQKDHLLLPAKQPLTTPKSTSKTLNPSSRPASQPIRSTAATATINTTTAPDNGDDAARNAPPIEIDLSRIPQPFLDPSLWENMKAVGRLRQDMSSSTSVSTSAGAGAVDFEAREREEMERRRRARVAEFGGMAVRGRKNVR